jgi:hypothetical protein
MGVDLTQLDNMYSIDTLDSRLLKGNPNEH